MTDLPIERLQQVEPLREVPDEQLQWLIAKGQCQSFKQGETLFKKGDPIDGLLIVLKGGFNLRIEQNGQFRNIGSLEEGSISGILPYSRADNALGQADATADSEVFTLRKQYFHEMIQQRHELTTALVHVMSSRIRQFTKQQQQNDKMMALGKLSAGLAHELNNPSAALIRSAQMLRDQLSLKPDKLKSWVHMSLSDEQIDQLHDIMEMKIQAGPRKYALREKTALEDALAEKLESFGLEDGYDVAEHLVTYGFTSEELDQLVEQLPKEEVQAVITWMGQVLGTERLVHDIEQSSQRIHDLVRSVKSYTHMDQAAERQAVDIHEGIDNTLTMLRHKLKKENIETVKNYQTDLPHPCIYVSEMNQVWTNLIDNAIDALSEVKHEKKLEITTQKHGDVVQVEIRDNGHGIPEAIQGQIFDPFFTTKSVGQGTGLGLDIVQQIINQHHGSIEVASKTGETVFKICLPIE